MKVKIYYAEIAPELESTEFDLNSVKVKGECIIGRSPECGLVLDGADLSRQHAKFFSKDGNYYFFDLGSRNGSLFNGELAQANREYLLSPGDSIRIGDFILAIEQEAEIAATVFKVIDPSFFKSDRSQVEAISQSEVLLSSPPEADESTDRAMPSPIIIIDRSIAIDIPDRVAEEHPKSDLTIDRSTDENILDRVAKHPESVADRDESNEDNVLDRVTAEKPAPAIIFDESNRDNILDRVSENDPIAARANDEIDNENILDRVSQEYPLPTLNNDEWDEKEDIIDNPVPAAQSSLELTVDESDEEDTSEVEAQEQPSLGLTSNLGADVIANVETTAQPSLALIANESEEEDTSETEVQPLLGLNIDRSTEDVTPETESEEQQSLALVLDRLAQEDNRSNADNEDLSQHELAKDEVEDELDETEVEDLASSTLDLDEEEEDIAEPESHEQSPSALTIDEFDEKTTPTAEMAKQPSLVPVAAADAIVDGVAIDSNKISSELLKTKQIVLIAHDTKIADLTDIVERHQEFLSKCLTITWSSIADLLKQETGMAVSKEIPSGASGGYQTIAGLVNSGDILAVIFLKDFFAQSQTGQANEEALLRLCNINEIMLATNIATADAIVNYLRF